jgi:hypothetical protein
MKPHRCNLAFFGCDFGENPFGILLALTTDMMHLFESGVIPYLLKVFVRSMTNLVWVRFDALIEKMFLPLQSSRNKDVLRTNFKNGS